MGQRSRAFAFASLLLPVAVLSGTVLGQEPAKDASKETAAVSSETVPAAEIDAAAFGFSISGLAASIGVKIQGLLGTRSALDQVRDLIDPAALHYDYYRQALKVLSDWSGGTQYDGLVRVNRPLKPGFVNFYILGHKHLQQKAPRLACNCSYVPGSWSIVCDSAFLAGAQRLLEGGARPPAPPQPQAATDQKAEEKDKDAIPFEEIEKLVMARFRNFLFEWVIAHELGHLMRSHTVTDMSRPWVIGNAVSIGRLAEKEADEFYISRLQHDQQRQFNAWLGLSNVVTSLYRKAVRAQHPAEVAEQIKKEGNAHFLFDAKFDVNIKYAPELHPPLLMRALNLANLVIQRYPQMIDTTGYFAKIRDRSHPVAVDPKRGERPDSPDLCGADNDDDRDKQALPLLAKHLDLLTIEEAPRAWIDALLVKLRAATAQQQNDQVVKISTLSTDLLATRYEPQEAARAKIAKIEAEGTTLAAPFKPMLQLRAFLAKADSGLLPDTTSAASAVKEAEDLINALIDQGAMDLGQPAEHGEALRLVLQTAVSVKKLRDAESEDVVDNIVGSFVGLSGASALDDQLFLELLLSDMARVSSGEQTRQRVVAKMRVAQRIIALASARGWPMFTTLYLASQVALMETLQPKPLEPLMFNYYNLGRQVRIFGSAPTAPAMFHKSLDNADALLASDGLSAADRKGVAAMRLTILNNLGWSFLTIGRYADAVGPLETARKERVDERAGRTTCEKSRREDVEFATVSQNLADTTLALGRYKEALDYARQARQCRSELDVRAKVIESTRTEGFALIYSGDEAGGRVLLQSYSDAVRQLLDDDVLPPNDPLVSGAIVNGEFVPLERYAKPPKSRLEPETKPSAPN